MKLEVNPTSIKLYNSVRVGGKQYTYIDTTKSATSHIKVEVDGEWLAFTCTKSGMVSYTRANNVIEMSKQIGDLVEQQPSETETKTVTRRGRAQTQVTA